MYDVFVCYMHVLDVFEVIYMNIYVFAILKCRELMKNKKNKKNWWFFAVRMRTAKDHLVTLPCVWQRSHVAITCDSQGGDVHAGKLFAVRACGRRTAKAMVRRTAKLAARQRKTHGSAATHGNVQNARQRSTHGNGEGRTAKKYGTAEMFDARQRSKHTAKGVAVQCGKNARQRIRCRAVHCRALFVVRRRTTKPLPCVFPLLPCVLPARQSTVLR
jgi:hypothetical protein